MHRMIVGLIQVVMFRFVSEMDLSVCKRKYMCVFCGIKFICVNRTKEVFRVPMIEWTVLCDQDLCGMNYKSSLSV
jgi:hypothetical protein